MLDKALTRWAGIQEILHTYECHHIIYVVLHKTLNPIKAPCCIVKFLARTTKRKQNNVKCSRKKWKQQYTTNDLDGVIYYEFFFSNVKIWWAGVINTSTVCTILWGEYEYDRDMHWLLINEAEWLKWYDWMCKHIMKWCAQQNVEMASTIIMINLMV